MIYWQMWKAFSGPFWLPGYTRYLFSVCCLCPSAAWSCVDFGLLERYETLLWAILCCTMSLLSQSLKKRWKQRKINKNPKTNKEKKYLEKRFALSFPEEHEKTSEGKLGFSIAAPSSILLTPDAFEVKTVFRGYLRTNRLQLSFMVNVIIKQA